MQVEVKNVKTFQILNSTFSHVPQLGIKVERTANLQIMDNIFLKVGHDHGTHTHSLIYLFFLYAGLSYVHNDRNIKERGSEKQSI